MTSGRSASLAYLASDEALDSLRRDPYWPKWDSPWWHMTLLWELGEATHIPARVVDVWAEVLDTHFVEGFPLREEEIPAGADPYRHIACHCALGTAYRVLADCGVDVDARLPWVRPWFLRYQLPDGGLNCDEQVYLRETPRSSVVSTLPPLEAVLFHTARPWTEAELSFLDRGAEYLLARRLYRSVSGGGRVIDADWATPCFPRFYHYDVLRGLRFLVHWAERRGRRLPREAVEEVVGVLEVACARDDVGRTRRPWTEEGTLAPTAEGEWLGRQPARRFAALEEADGGPVLRAEWEDVRSRLERVS